MANEKKVGRALRYLAAPLFAGMLFFGCGPNQQAPSTEDDVAAINAIIDGMTDAYAARDWHAFAGFFADDAVWMPPGVAPLRGRDAWWEWVQPWWGDSTVVDIGVSTEDLIVSEKWAIERHVEYQSIIFGEGVEPATLYFKGIWIFHRQETGAWKIAQYIWNENTRPN